MEVEVGVEGVEVEGEKELSSLGGGTGLKGWRWRSLLNEGDADESVEGGRVDERTAGTGAVVWIELLYPRLTCSASDTLGNKADAGGTPSFASNSSSPGNLFVKSSTLEETILNPPPPVPPPLFRTSPELFLNPTGFGLTTGAPPPPARGERLFSNRETRLPIASDFLTLKGFGSCSVSPVELFPPEVGEGMEGRGTGSCEGAKRRMEERAGPRSSLPSPSAEVSSVEEDEDGRRLGKEGNAPIGDGGSSFGKFVVVVELVERGSWTVGEE